MTLEPLDEQSGKNFITDETGTISEAVPAAGCVVSFVDCDTKKTVVVSLKPGDTFSYGDWDGKKCVRKKFNCPK